VHFWRCWTLWPN